MTEFPLIEVRNLRKYYGDKRHLFTALDGISIDILRGKNLAVVGETGSGKTTLGRITCGLEKPSSGTVMFDGIQIGDIKQKVLWKGAQYLHQDPYSAIDNLETVKNILQNPLKYLLEIKDQTEISETMEQALNLAGLNGDYLDKKGGDLSGGEKQRVLVARAFEMRPRYVVADEPTTMVDYIHRKEMIKLLSSASSNIGTSVMLITHDINLVPEIASRIIIMYKGKIIESGSVDEVFKAGLHPYTKFLLRLDPLKLRNETDLLLHKGNNSKTESLQWNKGCVYYSECPIADRGCILREPQLTYSSRDHEVACFKPGEYSI